MKRVRMTLTVVLVLLALGAVGVEANSFFRADQVLNCNSTSWSFCRVLNLTSFIIKNSGTDSFGNYSQGYTLQYNIWIGAYIYEYATAKWEELIYLFNQNL